MMIWTCTIIRFELQSTNNIDLLGYGYYETLITSTHQG